MAALCPSKVELRSFHGDLCMSFLHVVIVATDSSSHSRMLPTRPHRDGSSNGVHSRQNRDGTNPLYGLRPTRVPTSRRRCLRFPSRGYLETRRPRNLSVSWAGQASRSSISRKVTRG